MAKTTGETDGASLGLGVGDGVGAELGLVVGTPEGESVVSSGSHLGGTNPATHVHTPDTPLEYTDVHCPPLRHVILAHPMFVTRSVHTADMVVSSTPTA